MNNEDIINKRNQAIQEANDVYNQIINDQTNLINDQSNQIDDYLTNSKNTINQSVNNNISALESASETARRQHEAEKQAIMNNYNNYTANNIDESVRIGALNSARNRINTSAGNLNDIVQEYNNQIAQAKISGDSMIAQNALEMLKEKLNLQITGINSNNDLLIAQQNNSQQLTENYGNLDAKYSSVRNDYLDRQEDYRQFNKEMAYNTQQLNTKKKLMEQQYQLDLQDAKDAYYSRRYSSSGSSGYSNGSGGYSLSNNTSASKASNTNKNTNLTGSAVAGMGLGALTSNSTKYYANHTPSGLTSDSKKVYNKLTNTVLNKGYVTQTQLVGAISKLPKSQQGIILSAFKVGTLK